MKPPPKPRPASATRRWFVTACVLALTTAILIAAALNVFWLRRLAPNDRAPVEPPQIDLANTRQEVIQAITTKRQKVVDNPHSGDAWGQLAMVFRAHDFDFEANSCFEQAERLAPDNPRWAYLHGVSLNVSDAQMAMACYRRAIKLDPHLTAARLRLGEELLAHGDVQAAQAQFQAALVQPNQMSKGGGPATNHHHHHREGRAELGLARAALLMGNVKKSLSWAQKAEQANRGKIGKRAIHDLLAKIHHRLGDQQQAQKQLAILQRLPPGRTTWSDPLVGEIIRLRKDPEFRMGQLQKSLAQGKGISEIIPQLEEIVKQNPENSEYHAQLAQVLLENGRAARAAEVLETALQQHGKSSALWRQRGDLHFHQEEWQDAVKCYRQAIQLKPDNASAYDGLGSALVALSDYDGAAAAFGAALQIRPSLAGTHVNLGRLLLQRGRTEEGEKHLQMAENLAPSNMQIRLQIEDARRTATQK